jgi:hypothetical protein
MKLFRKKKDEQVYNFPVIRLSNGLRVGNFNSPHPIIFEDGSVLGPVLEEEAKDSYLTDDEVNRSMMVYTDTSDVAIGLSSKGFHVSEGFLKRFSAASNLLGHGKIDFFIVSIASLLALKHARINSDRFYTVHLTDSTNNIASINSFCE